MREHVLIGNREWCNSERELMPSESRGVGCVGYLDEKRKRAFGARRTPDESVFSELDSGRQHSVDDDHVDDHAQQANSWLKYGALSIAVPRSLELKIVIGESMNT